MKPLAPDTTPLDFAAIRSRLAGTHGQEYWRSLDELAQTKDFQQVLHREFPALASEFTDEVSRRNFLKLMGASLALAGLTSCTRQPIRQIVPYVKQPEEIIPGIPLSFATAMQWDGFATGLLVVSHEGHPTKIEGNPDHPSSLGATNVFHQASLLDLYDPDRSQAVTNVGEITTWSLFQTALNNALEEQKPKRGAGLRILTETVTSPTLSAQLQELLKTFPAAKWHQYQPNTRDNAHQGARMTFGEWVEPRYYFDKARVILSLDSDFLFSHPEGLRYTRKFTEGRRVSQEHASMNRLYVAESTPSITGSMADHRLPTSSADVENLARALAHRLGVDFKSTPPSSINGTLDKWIAAVALDLQNNQGSCLVVPGDRQPPVVHALAHMMNQKLGNFGKTLDFTASAEAQPIDQLQSLRELVQDMDAGRVECLVILGGNPVFSAPADFAFAEQLSKVKLRVHLSPQQDETSAYCHWHIPETHFLEAWSDARAFDGTTSIIQPLIAPLYDTKTVHELAEVMMQRPLRSDYDIVRDYWRTRLSGSDFESAWRKALHDGLISGTELPPRHLQIKSPDSLPPASPAQQTDKASALEVSFLPDPSIWDGRFANNGWLQELSKPFTKLTWDNAALISPALAEQRQLSNGDIVQLGFHGRTVRAPVWIMPGQAANSVTLHLGYGRTRVGRVGEGTGFNAYSLRTSDAMSFGSGLELTKTGARHLLASTQLEHSVHGRNIVRHGTIEEFRAKPGFLNEKSETPPPEETLYNAGEFKNSGPAWGMVINLSTCIGCNACVLACQSENNIPVVGKDQVSRGRDMLWIRVDQYFKGGLENPTISNQPVPCMHCENAPCELVCPVEATLHDHEGLNLQVYNRCVGTRYCSNNCPYKVRRFNFLRYSDYRDESLKPMRNPNVTVRWRGVMEKCTYCIQRISATRIQAEKENRRIGGNEVVTACQQVCPAEAIIFGDINDPNSNVAKLKARPLNYSMLGELNTRPRTTYLARLSNPNPDLAARPA
ncbi:MAG: molybdopterin oxidoreductase, iron-sulfur binding subunit [Pedosphaera sp.]|nr:molybdopterin oxidoreductase, iron-sulfur binding subunit [Pedosphaera sp.]